MFSSSFNALISLQDAMERSMNNDFFGFHTSQRGTPPAINILQKESQIMLSAELPGVKREDIKIEVKGDLFRISGKRKLSYADEIKVHRLERGNFQFDRSVTLPFEVDQDKIEAKYEDGVLSVIMYQAESSKPRQIKIN